MNRLYFRELIDFCGTQSAGRFAFLFSVLLSNVVVWYTWLFICIWTRTMIDIPLGVYTALGVSNGIAFIGKGVQSFAERPYSSPINESVLPITKENNKMSVNSGSQKSTQDV